MTDLIEKVISPTFARVASYMPHYKKAMQLAHQFHKEGEQPDNAVSRAARTMGVDSHTLLSIAKQQRLGK